MCIRDRDMDYVLRDDILRVVDNWGMYEAWSEELPYPWHDSIELIGAYYLDWIKEGKMKADPVSYTHLDVYKRQLYCSLILRIGKSCTG